MVKVNIRPAILRPQQASNSLGGLVKLLGSTPKCLIHGVWGGAHEFAFLTSSENH